MPRNPQPYSEQRPSAADLFQKHSVLVKRIAHHLMARLPDHVQIDDLIQAGLEGLLEAANNFETGHGASFETYAGIRIRGAMLDEMRRGDWSPRSVHRNARRMAQVHNELEASLGRTPTVKELAAALEVGIDEYQAMAKNTLGVRLSSLDEPVSEENVSRRELIADNIESPEALVEADEMRANLAAAIEELPERDQLLLSLYYKDELNLKEIGEVLGVSESRVSQLHSQAALKLRSKLIEK